MRCIYKDKTGVIVNDEQFEILKDFFTQDKPSCVNREVTLIQPAVALSMVAKAKEAVAEPKKEEPKEEPKVEVKPKRKRRSKEQIEADKLAGK